MHKTKQNTRIKTDKEIKHRTIRNNRKHKNWYLEFIPVMATATASVSDAVRSAI